MNKSFLKTITLVTICAAVFVGRASADMIHGVVTFGGSVTLDSNHVNTATQVTSWVNTHVEAVDGDLASYISSGDAATIAAPWSFNSGAVANFWTVGGFTFDLSYSNVVVAVPGFLNVSGVGLVSGNGFDVTHGVWAFTTQDGAAAGKFSFSSASSVPDGGFTAMLLGMGLLGLSIAYRFRPALQKI